MKSKCVVLFSGGLDSRLVAKIMQERNFDIIALHFKLPFSKDVIKEVKDFCKKEKIKLRIFDFCKGKLLKDYLRILKNAKFGRGAGFNCCVDCKIFMFRKAKEFADKKEIQFVATGEVDGQRPMSQTAKSLNIIKEKSNLSDKLLRPLNEIGISGRNRKKQIELAKKFRISYPYPAGGCLLCEKALKKRFDILIKNNLINYKTLKLVNIGRHFFKDNCWFVVARNEKECVIIEKSKGNFVKGKKGKPAVYFSKKSGKDFAEKLQEDFGKGGGRKFSKDIL